MKNSFSLNEINTYKSKYETYLKILIYTSFFILTLLFVTPLFQIPLYYLCNTFWFINYSTLIDFLGKLSLAVSLLYILLNATNRKNYIKSTINKYKFIIPFCIFLFWIFICCIFSSDYNLAFYGSEYRSEGFFMYVNYFSFFILGLIVSKNNLYIFKNYHSMIKIIVFINSTISSLVGLMVIYQYFFPYNDKITVTNTTGVFFHFNHCGYYLAFSIICILFSITLISSKAFKILYSILFITTSCALIINETFGGYLAVFISLIVIFLISKFKYKSFKLKYLFPLLAFITITLIMSLLGFGSIKDDIISLVFDFKFIIYKLFNIDINLNKNSKEKSNTGVARIILWKLAIKYSFMHPLLGSGLEQVGTFYHNMDLIQTKPANEYLYILTSSGYPGFVLYIISLGSIFKNCILKIKAMDKLSTASFIIVLCYSISAFFGNSTFYITPYFMVFLAFTAISTYNIYSTPLAISPIDFPNAE